MPTDPANTPREKPKLFTFRSGGWALLAAAALVGILLWQVFSHLSSRDYVWDRFDRAGLSVPADRLTVAKRRDFVNALVDPGALTVKELEENPERWLRKLLVGSDRVIGVTIGDESRVYPLRVLNWHEAANDTLGGVPIVVSYGPLTDSVAVFDRRVGGETLVFGVSGLLFQSNQLLYDRRPEIGTESLWSQLRASAIAGPAAVRGERLEPQVFSLVTWETWKGRHPETTVVKPDPIFYKHYPRRPYASYYGTRSLRYPVAGYPPENVEQPWGHVALLTEGDGTKLVDADALDPGELPPMLFYALRWAWIATRPAE